jgi:hypothetical protein
MLIHLQNSYVPRGMRHPSRREVRMEPVNKVKKLCTCIVYGRDMIVHLNLQFLPHYTALKFNLNVFDFHNSANKIQFMMFESKLETMCYI